MLVVIEVGNGGWPYPLNGDTHPFFLSTSSAAALRSAVETPGVIRSFTAASTLALIRPASRMICNSAALLIWIWRAQLIRLFLQCIHQGLGYFLNGSHSINFDQFPALTIIGYQWQ